MTGNAFRRNALIKKVGGMIRSYFAVGAAIGCALFLGAAQNASADGLSLGKNLNAPGPIALDGSGAHLFFGQTTQSACGGELDNFPADAGTKTQVANGTALFDSGYCRGIDRMAFSGAAVVYGYGGYVTYNIDEASASCGNHCQHLVSGMQGGAFLGVFNGSAYFSFGFRDINSIPLTGGSSNTLASGYFVRAISFDTPNPNYSPKSNGLYFVDWNTYGAYRLDLKNNGLSTVMQGNPDEGSILTDSKNVYWSDGTQIISGAKNTTCTYPCSKLYAGTVTGFVADETELDNSKGSLFFSDNSNLWRLPKSGTASVVYTGANVRVLQTDGAAVYFLDNGFLKLLPVNANIGVAPLALASSASVSSSTLADGFYWTDVGNGNPGTGELNYVVQQVSQLDGLQYSRSDLAIKLYKCSCKAATFAMLARGVLRSHGQYVAATGVKIDYFFNTNGSQDPCPDKNAPGADWYAANGAWKNPVLDDVELGDPHKIGATDIALLVQKGPVLLGRSDSNLHWILATNLAKVTHGNDTASGIAAYDPLSGSKVLVQGQAGAYYLGLILDPKTNTWCNWTTDCPNLIDDMNKAALKFGIVKAFTSRDVSFLQSFTPSHYQAAVVKN